MRQKIVAGNWKMNLAYAQAMALSDAIADGLRDTGSCEVVLAPPFVYLHDVLRRVGHRDRISIAAQNCSSAESGAFTGEVSASMLASIGIEFALIGHSERRAFFGETDETVAGKVRQALRHGITPIFCCGETLAERESGSHIETVERQLMTGLLTLDEKDLSQCIIAYEPVWAIGTGRTASPEQAQEMHARIRSAVSKTAPAVSDRIPILYGGSVNSSNAASLFSAPDVDGALVGGASLKADEFLVIVELCS
ncbi:MAG: triosephosphate isomerase [Bacteroidota bacterium]|jgi:triosephosphate isomerase